MSSLVVSGKKLEEAEQKIRELELSLAASEKEVSMMKEDKTAMTAEIEKLKLENQALQKEVDNVVVSVGRKDLEKAADEMVGKAKDKVGDYLKTFGT